MALVLAAAGLGIVYFAQRASGAWRERAHELDKSLAQLRDDKFNLVAGLDGGAGIIVDCDPGGANTQHRFDIRLKNKFHILPQKPRA